MREKLRCFGVVRWCESQLGLDEQNVGVITFSFSLVFAASVSRVYGCCCSPFSPFLLILGIAL